MTYAPEAPALSPAGTTSQRHRSPQALRISELLLTGLAVVISAGAYALVGLGSEQTVPANVYQYAGWLAALALVLHLIVWWRARYADPVLVPLAVLLNGLGLAMIYRIDVAKTAAGRESNAAVSQLIWMTLGIILCALVIAFLRDHRMLRRYTYLTGLAALVLLMLPLVPGLGKTINGARIWIGVGGMSFQPGEIAKICLAIFFAGYLVSFRDQLVLAGPKFLGMQFPRPRDLGPIIIAWIASVGILVLQRDLGTSLLFFGLFVAVLYVGTGKKAWIFLGLGMFTAGALIASRIFSHVQQRLDGWLDALSPEMYNREIGGSYQLVQGLFGMAKGGLTGAGLGNGRPHIVPYAESDFIYASLGEELGLVGLFAILLLYVVLFERGMKIAQQLRDGFGTLLATGLSFTIALQCFIVIGGVTRLIPLTGLTTPFLAYGGSSLIANWIIIGLMLRMSDNARRPAEEFQTGVLTIQKPVDEDEAHESALASTLGRLRSKRKVRRPGDDATTPESGPEVYVTGEQNRTPASGAGIDADDTPTTNFQRGGESQ
ncbi:FtsW/RodA/SpoVE family cell cycle protein [Brevibacterium luteolum]|uniref:FtsW/RodA/SpoVE family cell cycle protein n=1 Tax=Brevibacterium luteolum TaxID=199591 RepID=UPI00223B67FA|nr:FtsW/RodA/SpoVE family cell cycle protein [Brevibacterium luteolum]MCT1873741.1 FtsW/RodA/SpoVE family cell cycle protein [Brevibacterium luteolum]MCT1891147.1 FtsW/RodA/SpoVE family cell cycle protein [Brevibacterium luteolum]MCT1893642.1 FtsW/RodA/SpoVE family cell cycle protein [Brevibacterium luteolum]MCT1924436.1 FtsW/RodA/SpoVE family cell cycle protein [Brevibacterium luteolum]